MTRLLTSRADHDDDDIGNARALGVSAAVLVVVLLIAGIVLAGTAHAEEGTRQEFVRVTYYTLPGRMADGNLVHEGAAACSRWIPMGTVLEFPDGRQVVCQDRGHGDWYWRGWVDVYGDSSVNRVYGDYTWVLVLRWGYDGVAA